MAHIAATPAAPHKFSGPRAPPRFSAIPSCSFSSLPILVAREPSTRKLKHNEYPCQDRHDQSKTPSPKACRRPAFVRIRCWSTFAATNNALFSPNATPTLVNNSDGTILLTTVAGCFICLAGVRPLARFACGRTPHSCTRLDDIRSSCFGEKDKQKAIGTGLEIISSRTSEKGSARYINSDN
ncbi:unnamed protein product [Chondrus crispus]|uniref:Uncharacterized protein n=1 Tax=Chondrus crispus TaxID=2769 RepID=R7QBY2_CHOCR|nr:unnamed protein product [Chondrus crispus]CDF34936.1 unnamed protein product [Chondrus crispus]|eukprot:XP_005714755.1 unnamed protein product [Chondrus crispus]